MEESVIATRPDDLITAAEAATRAAKSKSSIRNWVRIGKLTGYRKDPTISNSPLMISQNELRAYLAINGKITKPNTQGRKPDISVSLELLRLEQQKAQKELATKQAELDQARQLIRMQTDHMERMQKSTDEQILHLRSLLESQSKHLDLSRQSVERAEQNKRQLYAYLTLPWWKRMTSSLLLTG